ncbi:MAG: hypothetical protein J2P34_01850 [Actinobacteria bacterium]|nr:hypothetical protein [Actinomycetota bacterium]
MRKAAPARLATLAGAIAMAVLAAAPAAAAGRHAARVPSPVSLVITSVSPSFASPHRQVTVSGYITNTTAAPLSGLSIQLWSSGTALSSRGAMASYLDAASSAALDGPVANAVTTLPSLAAHATQRWSLSLKPADVGMGTFGVYPLAAQASEDGALLAGGHARTFLPFYPRQPAHSPQQKLRLAWVWPLIDTPQQAVCRALLTDGLAAAIAPTGRLGQLLTAGAGAAGRRDQITWAIDPSLLDGVSAMTRPYRVGGSATCSGGTARPASAAARAWLARVRAATAHGDFFVTPYADVDVAALSHEGLDQSLNSAFTIGRMAARNALGQSQRPPVPAIGSGATAGRAAGPAGRPNASRSRARPGWLAWPAGGLADYGVLGSLAFNKVGTVLLSSGMMPPSPLVPFTPSAVTSTATGFGTRLNVLLTDDGLDHIVADSPTASAPAAPAAAGPARVSTAAAAFATEQQFLAETAMIVAESPATARSVVVAPPRRWDPASGVAAALLAETARAPWLKPVSLARLAETKPGPGQVPRQQPPQHRVSGHELPPALLGQIRKLDAQIGLQASILTRPPPHYLSAAVATVESTAWGRTRAGKQHAGALLKRIRDYLTAQQQALQIVDPPRVTLGGKSGAVPVSISNRLRQPVTIRVKVTAPTSGRITFGGSSANRGGTTFTTVVSVAAGSQKTIKVPVRSAVLGSTTLTIRLYSPGGRPLPGQTAAMTVAATQFGTLAVVIIAFAFGIFVITSIGRAVRRSGGQDVAAAQPPAPGDHGEGGVSDPSPASQLGRPDTVGTERQDDGLAPEELDEHASARGRAEPP